MDESQNKTAIVKLDRPICRLRFNRLSGREREKCLKAQRGSFYFLFFSPTPMTTSSVFSIPPSLFQMCRAWRMDGWVPFLIVVILLCIYTKWTRRLERRRRRRRRRKTCKISRMTGHIKFLLGTPPSSKGSLERYSSNRGDHSLSLSTSPAKIYTQTHTHTLKSERK